MGTENLAKKLMDNCFFPVLGTVELSIGSLRNIREGGEPDLVARGVSRTWETNNGIMVVYDETGEPWIRSTRHTTPEWIEMFTKKHNLKRGALVPHSNDGGYWKRLMSEQVGVTV